MIDHISIGTHDLAKAKAFYTAALAPLGYGCLYADDASLGFGKEAVALWVLAVEDGSACGAAGLHVAFAAPDRESVDAFHAGALANGGRDNGRPGIREDYAPTYYAAFAVDPDGVRLEAHAEVAA